MRCGPQNGVHSVWFPSGPKFQHYKEIAKTAWPVADNPSMRFWFGGFGTKNGPDPEQASPTFRLGSRCRGTGKGVQGGLGKACGPGYPGLRFRFGLPCVRLPPSIPFAGGHLASTDVMASLILQCMISTPGAGEISVKFKLSVCLPDPKILGINWAY
jgi:hypothetical protein